MHRNGGVRHIAGAACTTFCWLSSREKKGVGGVRGRDERHKCWCLRWIAASDSHETILRWPSPPTHTHETLQPRSSNISLPN
ncbi:Hypothetical predicted protein [Cloeon dipterum]|uniref:Uncharacterized protein n=1 Tax=Cloeon dipterum TaxID=197152 RepID=A0A8S1E6W0_9INSE|nr:Hypothetical predicted protein [Cloeon dipterum]